MGWTGTHYYGPLKTARDKRIAMDTEMTNGEWKILKSSVVNNVYYAAMKNPDNYVFGLVCLISVDNKDYFNLNYKDMDETMIPAYYDCPKSILKLLSPTDRETSLIWRQKCLEQAEKKKAKPKVKTGDIIEFEKPMSFTNGYTGKRFEVVDWNGTKVFKMILEGTNNRPYVKIRKWRQMEYKIIAA